MICRVTGALEIVVVAIVVIIKSIRVKLL